MIRPAYIVDRLLETEYGFPDIGEQNKDSDYDSGELDPDSPEAYYAAAKAKLDSVKKLEVYGKRWWRRGAGGEYCSADIYINGKHVHTTPYQGGGGDHYLTLAGDWLRRNGWINLDRRSPLWQLRDKSDIDFVYSVRDVPRQRDLL